MSDLQDVIVSSSIRAFNAGLATGIIQEKERIINLLETAALNAYDDGPVTMNDGIKACIALIKGEQK
jgi:hypothetical protein